MVDTAAYKPENKTSEEFGKILRDNRCDDKYRDSIQLRTTADMLRVGLKQEIYYVAGTVTIVDPSPNGLPVQITGRDDEILNAKSILEELTGTSLAQLRISDIDELYKRQRAANNG